MKLSHCKIMLLFCVLLANCYAKKERFIEKIDYQTLVYNKHLSAIDDILNDKNIDSCSEIIKSLLNDEDLSKCNDKISYLKFLLKRERIIKDYSIEKESKFLIEVTFNLKKEYPIDNIVLLEKILLDTKQYYQFLSLYKTLDKIVQKIIKDSLLTKDVVKELKDIKDKNTGVKNFEVTT